MKNGIRLSVTLSSFRTRFQRYSVAETTARPLLSSFPNFVTIPHNNFVKFGAIGAVANDSNVLYNGAGSIRIATDGTANFTDARMTTGTINANSKWIACAIKCENINNISEIQVTYGTSGLTNRYRWGTIQGSQGNWWLTNDEWQVLILPYQEGAASGTPNRGNVTDYQIRLQSSSLPATNVWIGGMGWIDTPPKRVSVRFDDGYDSVYTKAWPILQANSIPFTMYVPAEYVGAAGRLTLAQIREMVASGLGEIGYHGTGNDQRVMTSSALRALIESDLTYWANMNIRCRTAAYPGGEEDYTVDGVKIRDIYAEYFAGSIMVFQGQVEYSTPADRHRIKNKPYITNAITTTAVATEVANIEANGGWMVQAYHEIVDATADQTTKYLTADFQTNMQALAAKTLWTKGTIGSFL